MQAEMQRESTQAQVLSFEDVMASAGRWMVAAEALAALGAELSLLGGNTAADPALVAALREVSHAAGLANLESLPPPQREMAIGMTRLTLHHAVELVDAPGRLPGWTYSEPAILEGWGRGSMVVPGALKAAAPELANVRSFLDIGAGVGLLAVAAARTWPDARIVGIDVWPASLQAAERNVREAGLGDRIAIRNQDVAELGDVDAYECVWFPTFFFNEEVFDAAMPRVVRALQPGGWLVLGRFVTPPDPLAAATSSLRLARGGGVNFDTQSLTTALERMGCVGVRVLPRQGPAPLEYVIGQRAP